MQTVMIWMSARVEALNEGRMHQYEAMLVRHKVTLKYGQDSAFSTEYWVHLPTWEGLALFLILQVKAYLEDAKQSKPLPPMTPRLDKSLVFVKHYHSYWKEVTFVARVRGPCCSH